MNFSSVFYLIQVFFTFHFFFFFFFLTQLCKLIGNGLVHFGTFKNTFGYWQKKMYLRTCAPSEDSDQPVHPRSLIWVLARRSVDSSPMFLHADIKESDQTVRMRKPIRVFALYTCHKVHCLMLRLNLWSDEKVIELSAWNLLVDIHPCLLCMLRKYFQNRASRTVLWTFLLH